MKTKPTRIKFVILAAIGLLIGGLSSAFAAITVACVGDSITAGWGLANPNVDSYPAQLQTILGSGYAVGNYGLPSATALKRSDLTYWNTFPYRNSQRLNPNIVVMMFGANDSKAWNWDAARFNTDYKALIAKYQGLSSHPRVYICLTTPIYTPNPFGTAFDPVFIQSTVIPAIRDIATQAGVTLIDNNTPLLNHPEWFFDGVHPTPEGAGVVANIVATAITAP
jgi:lysophospholipase L1-like esterase